MGGKSYAWGKTDAEYQREFRIRYPGRYLVNKARARVKLKHPDMEFSITENDFDLPTHCPILGFELKYETATVTSDPASASLDRIDNTRGYVPGNVAVISLRANALKRDATVEELTAIVAYMTAHRHGDEH